MNYSKTNTENGFALLLALIISSVVLAIGVSLLNISVNQINLSTTARESEFAFQASHAGIDCMSYWRSEKASAYTSSTTATANPSVNCFTKAPQTTSKTVLSQVAGQSVSYKYTNVFEWGSPLRCTSVDMYVMNAYNQQITLPFANKAVGTNGSKVCKVGNTCTVLISDGYNRACGEIGTSIFSIQRELTVEF